MGELWEILTDRDWRIADGNIHSTIAQAVLPLGIIGKLRTQIEADILIQNMMVLAEAMGLSTNTMRVTKQFGAWPTLGRDYIRFPSGLTPVGDPVSMLVHGVF
jgi:hypothetical protein